MGSGEELLGKHRSNASQGYRLYTNVQAWSFPRQTCCPVCEQEGHATEVLFGKNGFRLIGRLTGFGRARNIVRIRTNWAVAEDALVAQIVHCAAKHRN